MQIFGIDFSQSSGLVLLSLAAVALYIASRAAVDALVKPSFPSPGARALGHWMPVAVVAIMAVIQGRAELGVAIVFSTSVAALSLVIGSAAFVHPEQAQLPWRRTWPLLLPAALIAFLAGFGGRLGPVNAIILLVEGVVVFLVWRDRRANGQGNHGIFAPVTSASETPPATEPPMDGSPRAGYRVLEMGLAVALSIVAAWAVVGGAVRISQSSRAFSTGLVVSILVGPLLTLPMVGAGTELAQRNQSWLAMATQVGVVLLNLCVLLPVVVLLNYVMPVGKAFMAQITPAQVATTTRAVVETPPTLIELFTEHGVSTSFPMAVWRVDGIVLIALSFVMLPVGLGRWSLGRREGFALIVAYALYLVLATAMGTRWS